jgi:hypothetical protein
LELRINFPLKDWVVMGIYNTYGSDKSLPDNLTYSFTQVVLPIIPPVEYILSLLLSQGFTQVCKGKRNKRSFLSVYLYYVSLIDFRPQNFRIGWIDT